MKLRRRHLSLVIASLLFACGETDKPSSPGPGPGVDAGGDCNPVTQQGCLVGEKCADLVEQVDPLLRRVACVADGTQADGEACTQGEAGATTGFDDCEAGLSCLNGACSAICSSNPDSCRTEGDSFGEGAYCTQFVDLLDENVGLCVPGCNPVEADGCAEGFGCYLDSNRAVASCTGVPAPAQELAQNSECYGPASGGCFLNGCASGYTPMLNNKPENADASVCARYCTPGDTYEGSNDAVEGVAGNCSGTSLAQSGGTNGNSGAHQCRYLQSFYSDTDNLPAELGICVPVAPLGGGTWGDCELLDWDGIRAAWNGAVEAETDPNTALSAYCLENPEDAQNSETLPRCIGLARGCLSLEEQDTGLLDPTGGAFLSRQAWAASIGLDLPLFNGDWLHRSTSELGE